MGDDETKTGGGNETTLATILSGLKLIRETQSVMQKQVDNIKKKVEAQKDSVRGEWTAVYSSSPAEVQNDGDTAEQANVPTRSPMLLLTEEAEDLPDALNRSRRDYSVNTWQRIYAGGRTTARGSKDPTESFTSAFSQW